MGHKRLVLRPRCIGNGRSRTQVQFIQPPQPRYGRMNSKPPRHMQIRFKVHLGGLRISKECIFFIYKKGTLRLQHITRLLMTACPMSDSSFFLANDMTCNIPCRTKHRDKGHFGFQVEKGKRKEKGGGKKKAFVTEHKFLFQKRYLIITCLRWQHTLRWSRNYPRIAESSNSLPHSQQSTTSPYLATDE